MGEKRLSSPFYTFSPAEDLKKRLSIKRRPLFRMQMFIQRRYINYTLIVQKIFQSVQWSKKEVKKGKTMEEKNI